MRNLLTFLEEANSGYFLLEEKEIKKEFLYYLAQRCGFKVIAKKKNGRTYYLLKKLGIPCERLYTREEKNTFNYIDMADLHIGNEACEISKIKCILSYAVREHVDYVFIAGDVLDGVNDSNSSNAVEIFERQISLAFSIFRNYPLDIRVIPGNHDFTFDYVGIRNPLRTLEKRLQDEVCNFKVYDGNIQDFEIAGVIKRMVHLESYYFHDNVPSAVQRLYEFNEHGSLSVKCDDNEYRPIKFFECGHVHKTIEMYDSKYNVYISQPGCFLSGQSYYEPFIHVKGEVLDDLRIVRG